MQFTINLSDQPVFVLQLNMEKKSLSVLEKHPDPLITGPILAPEDLTYSGFENRLNHFMGLTDKSLPQLIQILEEHGFRADMQHNVTITAENYTLGHKHTDHAITLSSDNDYAAFGNTNVLGQQFKGAVIIDGQDTFVKLDRLNPAINDEWENQFDYQYSSISESLVAMLLNRMNLEMDWVNYQFAVFDDKGTLETGTYAPNFLQDQEVEHILANGRYTDAHTVLDIDTFADDFMDQPADKAFTNLVDMLSNENRDSYRGMTKEEVSQFLLQQAAIDILVGNKDRMHNPGNFVMRYNAAEQKGRLVNFDFGRCLPMLWTQTSEERMDMTADYVEEMVEEFAETMTANNDSILSSLTQKEALDFLFNRGFKRIVFDKAALLQDLDTFSTELYELDLPCQKFAQMKIKTFKEVLNNELFTKLCLDIPSKELTTDTMVL